MSTKSLTPKVWAIVFAAILLIFGVYVLTAVNQMKYTKILYAHSEGITAAGADYKILKIAACDGPQGSIVLESAASGSVALGNSSVLKLSDYQMLKLNNVTWTFTYFAVANVTEKTKLDADVYLVCANGTTTLIGDNIAETGLITATNASYAVTFEPSEWEVDNEPIDLAQYAYLKVVWYADKSDVTALKVTLWLDVTATPTKIAGVSYIAIVTPIAITSMIGLILLALSIGIVIVIFRDVFQHFKK